MVGNYSEVFHLNSGDHLLVTVLETYSTDDNTNIFDNRMVVEYKEVKYNLDWDDYDNIYKGKVDGKLGYVY